MLQTGIKIIQEVHLPLPILGSGLFLALSIWAVLKILGRSALPTTAHRGKGKGWEKEKGKGKRKREKGKGKH